MNQNWSRFRRAVLCAYEHGSLGYAKGAAYSALLAFFPILTTTTAILAHINAGTLSLKIIGALFKVVPPGVGDLIRQILSQGSRPLALPILAILLSLWAGSGVMMSLMEGFQAAYQRKSRRDMFHNRGIAMWLVLVRASGNAPIWSATSPV